MVPQVTPPPLLLQLSTGGNHLPIEHPGYYTAFGHNQVRQVPPYGALEAFDERTLVYRAAPYMASTSVPPLRPVARKAYAGTPVYRPKPVYAPPPALPLSPPPPLRLLHHTLPSPVSLASSLSQSHAISESDDDRATDTPPALPRAVACTPTYAQKTPVSSVEEMDVDPASAYDPRDFESEDDSFSEYDPKEDELFERDTDSDRTPPPLAKKKLQAKKAKKQPRKQASNPGKQPAKPTNVSSPSASALTADCHSKQARHLIWKRGAVWQKGVSVFRRIVDLPEAEREKLIKQAQSGKLTTRDLSEEYHVSPVSISKIQGSCLLRGQATSPLNDSVIQEKIQACVALLKKNLRRPQDCLAKDLEITKHALVKNIIGPAREKLREYASTTTYKGNVWALGTGWKKGVSVFRRMNDLSAEEREQLTQQAQSGQFTNGDLSEKYHVPRSSISKIQGSRVLQGKQAPSLSSTARQEKIKACIETFKKDPRRPQACIAKDLELDISFLRNHIIGPARAKMREQAEAQQKDTSKATHGSSGQRASAPSDAAQGPPAKKRRTGLNTARVTQQAQAEAQKKGTSKATPKGNVWALGTEWKKGISVFRSLQNLTQKERDRLDKEARSGAHTVDELLERFHVSRGTLSSMRGTKFVFQPPKRALSLLEKQKKIDACVALLKKYPGRSLTCVAKDLGLTNNSLYGHIIGPAREKLREHASTTAHKGNVWALGTGWKKGVSIFRRLADFSAKEREALTQQVQSGKFTAEQLSETFHVSRTTLYGMPGKRFYRSKNAKLLDPVVKQKKINMCAKLLRKNPNRTHSCLAKDLDVSYNVFRREIKEEATALVGK
ncbi:MAG: hypothetical protein V6Z78_01905 [Holosporaceae bacterium]